MIKVSIIVPIYNVENYLSKCIESIVQQTLKDIEIILINDGSTDDSNKVVEKYYKKDKRIIFIDKKNEGVSATRNLGIKLSKGKYIFFVDSDDWIEKDCIETFYKIIDNKKADIVCSSVLFRVEEKKIKKDNLFPKYFNEDKIEKVSFENYVGSIFTLTNGTSVCNKIFKRDIFYNNNIFFKNISEVFSEDGFLNLEYALKCKKIYFFYKAKYYYLDRKGSFTNEKRKWKEVISISLKPLDSISYKIPKSKMFILDYYKHFIYINIEGNIRKIVKYKDLIELVDDKLFLELIKSVKFKKFTFYQKIRCLLLKNKLCIGLLIMNKLTILLKKV